jgi:plastocyanin
MTRLTIALAVLLAALVAVAGSAVAAKKPPPIKLVAKVGPDQSFKISLTKGGKKVTTLKHGNYVVLVYDTATVHNFHLTGGGLNKNSGVAFKRAKPLRWPITLKKGKTYHYVCDPHASLMKGSFTVS